MWAPHADDNTQRLLQELGELDDKTIAGSWLAIAAHVAGGATLDRAAFVRYVEFARANSRTEPGYCR